MSSDSLKAMCSALISEGLTAIHAAILLHVNEKTATMSELAKLSGHSTAASTQMMDRLEKLNLVTRHHSPEDRRNVVVGITPAGRSKLDALKKKANETYKPIR